MDSISAAELRGHWQTHICSMWPATVGRVSASERHERVDWDRSQTHREGVRAQQHNYFMKPVVSELHSKGAGLIEVYLGLKYDSDYSKADTQIHVIWMCTRVQTCNVFSHSCTTTASCPIHRICSTHPQGERPANKYLFWQQSRFTESLTHPVLFLNTRQGVYLKRRVGCQ